MTKVEIESNTDSKECDIRCPNCGSGKVRIDKKGYDYAKGAAGCCCCGWPGLICGGMGAKDLEGICLNCKNRFDVASIIKSKWCEKSSC
jgi:hypothetical protein